jgi:hypothetical protein
MYFPLAVTPAPSDSKRLFISASNRLLKIQPVAALVLLIAALSAFVFAEPLRAGSDDIPQYLTSPLRTDAEPIHIRLSGRDYFVPANYFDAVIRRGLDQRDILLVALLPSLETRTHENWDEFMKVPGFGRRVHMLIETVERPATVLGAMLQKSEYMSGPLETVGTENNVEHRVPVGVGRFGFRQEVFVARQEDRLVAVIECARDGDVRSPGCQQYFMADDLLIKATYSKKFLQNWRSIQESVTALLQRYRHE